VDALLARVATDEFEEGGIALVRQSATTGRGMTLTIDLHADGSASEHWVVDCENVRECRIGWGPASSLEFVNDHVLLAPYADAHVTLAIRGPVTDARHAVSDLWQAHQDLARDWFPMSAFLNVGMRLTNLLRSSGAIVAEGPSRFIDAYQKVLTMNGTDAYTPWRRAPLQWRDGAWLPEASGMSVLLLWPHYCGVGIFGSQGPTVAPLAFGTIGVAIGLARAVALAPSFSALVFHVFHVSPRDPIVLATTAGVLLAVVTLASYLPARRAVRIDPLVALQEL
jgi:hypothetical protein